MEAAVRENLRQEHMEWLNDMKQQRNALLSAALSSGSHPVGFAGPSASPLVGNSLLRGAFRDDTGITSGGFEDRDFEAGAFGSRGDPSFADQFADFDILEEEEPVYRSLSLSGFVEDSARDEDEQPVYRSLTFGSVGTQAGTMADVDAASQEWLKSMPPLISRQRGQSFL